MKRRKCHLVTESPGALDQGEIELTTMLPAMYVIPHGGIFVIANMALQRLTELKRAIGCTVVGDPKRGAAANPRML